MKSDPRTYHMDGSGKKEMGKKEWVENKTGKKEWVENKTGKRNADGNDELVGNKKLCTEGSESLNVLLSLIEPIILMCLRI